MHTSYTNNVLHFRYCMSFDLVSLSTGRNVAPLYQMLLDDVFSEVSMAVMAVLTLNAASSSTEQNLAVA